MAYNEIVDWFELFRTESETSQFNSSNSLQFNIINENMMVQL